MRGARARFPPKLVETLAALAPPKEPSPAEKKRAAASKAYEAELAAVDAQPLGELRKKPDALLLSLHRRLEGHDGAGARACSRSMRTATP